MRQQVASVSWIWIGILIGIGLMLAPLVLLFILARIIRLGDDLGLADVA